MACHNRVFIMDSDCSIPCRRQLQTEWQIGRGSICNLFLTSPFSLAAHSSAGINAEKHQGRVFICRSHVSCYSA